jgi:PAS domain S-box-containing protein
MAQGRILIVEDDPLSAARIREDLSGLGYVVAGIASSGVEAIKEVSEVRPDLVLMDIVLKGDMDGIKAAEHIGASFDVPVVYLTAYADADTLHRAKITEPYGYILKPCAEKELHTNIEIALYRHKMARQLEETRKRAEEERAKAEAMIEAIGDGLSIQDTNFRILFMNQNARDIFGDRVGEYCYVVFEGADRVCEGCPLAMSFADGMVHRTERSNPIRALHVEITASSMKDASGRIIAGIEVVRDITKRKRSEEALRESEERYRYLFECAHDMVQSVSPEGRFLFVNASWLNTMGYTRDELKDITLCDVLHPSCAAHCAEILDRVMAGESVGNIEAIFVAKDGRLIDVEGNVNMRRSGGKAIATQGIFRNITGRKKMEEEIRQAKDDWENTFNTITDMITIHDEDFNILRANEAAKKMLGLPSPGCGAARCYGYYHGTEHPPARCPSCKTLKTGKPAVSEIFEPHLGMFVEIRAIPRKGRNNKDGGLIHVVRDITARKKTEDLVQRQIQKLSALRAIDLAINSSLDLPVTLKVFLEHVISLLRVDAANVLLLNRQTDMLEYAASQGFRTGALRHTNLRLGEGYAGTAALKNRIMSISNLKEEDNIWARRGLLKDEDFIVYYGIPLMAKGRLTGVLEIFHRSPLAPDEEWFEFLESLALQAAIAIDNNSLFYDLERSNRELMLAYDGAIEGWSRALDYRDKATEGHSRRVSEITVQIARAMGMRDDELVNVRRGALLHDIGKMGMPDSVLLKPSRLSKEEWDIMCKHPSYAYDLLWPITFLRPAIDIPYCHHEKWDGTGYPRGLKAEQIPLSARIFAVVDVWDALCSDRPYRPAWSAAKALSYIRGQAGKHFDPVAVESFCKIFSEHALH